MNEVTDVELEQLRADIESLLPDTAVIYSNVATNETGFVSDNWTAAGTVACRLDSFSKGMELSTADSIHSYPGYIFTFPYNAPVTEKSQVVVDGSTFNILSVDVDKSWPVCLRAVAMKVET